MALNLNPNGESEGSSTTPGDAAGATPGKRTYKSKDSTAKAPKEKKTPKAKKAGRGRKVFGLSAAVLLGGVAAAGAYVYIDSATPNMVPVYALNTFVPANSAATLDMFTEIEAPANLIEGSTLIPAEELNGQLWFAEEDLQPGDLATDSNFDRNTRIDISVLDDPTLMAQSFTASAEDAVAGRLRAGDYVSILNVVSNGDSDVADFVLERVLLLDVSAEPKDVSTAGGDPLLGSNLNSEDINSRYVGVPRLYTVALTPEQTRILTAAKSGNLTVVLTRPDAPSITADGKPAPDAPATGEIAAPGTTEDAAVAADITPDAAAATPANPAPADAPTTPANQ